MGSGKGVTSGSLLVPYSRYDKVKPNEEIPMFPSGCCRIVACDPQLGHRVSPSSLEETCGDFQSETCGEDH